MTATEQLPHWDITAVYPALESPEFESGYQSAVTGLDQLTSLFDKYGINGGTTTTLDDKVVAAFEQIMRLFNTVREEARIHSAYIDCIVTTDTFNMKAMAEESRFRQQLFRLSLLYTRLVAWLGSLDVEALIARSTVAQEFAFLLRKGKEQAEHLMSPQEEELAAELEMTGSTAWNRLYSNFTSQIMVPLEVAGEMKELPMTALRNMAFEEDRDLRRRAYEAELAAWERNAMTITASLNSIKGELLIVGKRRKWQTPLDYALFMSNVDRATIDTMFSAAREVFPDFRRYLRTKARALGISTPLAWYDLFAPLKTSERTWSFSEATSFIIEQFQHYSPSLGNMAEQAFREHWIDAEPRNGKIGGAFCIALNGSSSRILSNFQSSFAQVSTLAHELGHAYHNVRLAEKAEFNRNTPMTLAETASTFCEAIVTHAALEMANPQEQLSILESSLQDACQIIIDITSRFIFETQLFEKRADRELGQDELCEIMLAAQRETYGDGLDSSKLHPYMWAVKPHYYGSTFYNFPYMFGLLFSLGLYARYQKEPESFGPMYDRLLASTGLDNAAELAEQFGIDLRSIDFWRSSLDILRANINRFDSLVA